MPVTLESTEVVKSKNDIMKMLETFCLAAEIEISRLKRIILNNANDQFLLFIDFAWVS